MTIPNDNDPADAHKQIAAKKAAGRYARAAAGRRTTPVSSVRSNIKEEAAASPYQSGDVIALTYDSARRFTSALINVSPVGTKMLPNFASTSIAPDGAVDLVLETTRQRHRFQTD